MVLNEICPPALMYLIFSVTQISIDTVQGQYNTAFAKIWVSIVFTIVLNYLCRRGLGIISWFIVFIPFMLMTLIISILLYVFGLDPATGRLKIYAPPTEFRQDVIDYRQQAMGRGGVPAVSGVPSTPPVYDDYYNQRDGGSTNDYARGSDNERDRNIGGQTDAHGCLTGAGYSYCDALGKCIGPGDVCENPKNIGGQTDAHGCLTGAGYSYCDALGKCIGPGDVCETPKNIGVQTDAHGCLTGAGYSYCDALGKCVGPGDPCLAAVKMKEAFSWPTVKFPTINVSAPLLKWPSMSFAADTGSVQLPMPTAISMGCLGAC
jgi:hypothetical protein